MIMEETDYKGAQENFGDDEYIHCLDRGNSLMDIYICRNVSNCII